MAAPITHIVLTEKIYKKYFSGYDKRKFMVGTSYPDIRYLGGFEREKTHHRVAGIGEVMVNDAFTAGVKFHNLLDQVREEYMKRNDFYSLFPVSKYTTRGVKLFEDQILYGKTKVWGEVAEYLDEVMDEEINHGLTHEQVGKWHKILKRIFNEGPSEEARVAMMIEEMGGASESVEHVLKVAREVNDLHRARQIVERFYEDFELNI